jgi:hypothetical protein
MLESVLIQTITLLMHNLFSSPTISLPTAFLRTSYLWGTSIPWSINEARARDSIHWTKQETVAIGSLHQWLPPRMWLRLLWPRDKIAKGLAGAVMNNNCLKKAFAASEATTILYLNSISAYKYRTSQTSLSIHKYTHKVQNICLVWSVNSL